MLVKISVPNSDSNPRQLTSNDALFCRGLSVGSILCHRVPLAGVVQGDGDDVIEGVRFQDRIMRADFDEQEFGRLEQLGVTGVDREGVLGPYFFYRARE